MTGRKADMSAAAADLYAELQSAGLAVPELDNLEQYRKDVRSGFDDYVQAAVETFQGEIRDIEVAGIPCKQLTPRHWSNADGRCIQYAYGGGYVSGSSYEDLIIAAPLAQLCEARIVMVDYRLSPEHPYPAPQQDMHQVYPELLARYGAARLVVCGESAGANQALGLMQQVRDLGLAMPGCAALFSPWCDLNNQGDSHIFNDGRDPTLSNLWTDIAAILPPVGMPMARHSTTPASPRFTVICMIYRRASSPPAVGTCCSASACAWRRKCALPGSPVTCASTKACGMYSSFTRSPRPDARSAKSRTLSSLTDWRRSPDLPGNILPPCT
jgi:acetyl esterase/lipase